jgi:hypothetical protein
LPLLVSLALALAVPVHEAVSQGTVIFNNRMPGASLHVWGPSTTIPSLSLVGLGSNDLPSGTTDFAGNGMALIGANGTGGHYGSAMTFAQLIGAVGSHQPESALVPLGQTTIFRSGTAAGFLAPVTDTLSAVAPYTTTISKDAAAATFEIVVWDNSSGLYSTWAQASSAWQQGLIAAGHSAPFTVTNIGGDFNTPPYLNNGAGVDNGISSFNLFINCLSCWYPPRAWTLPATDVTANSAVLHGQVDPNGYSTTAWFQWGTTTFYGNTTAATDAGSCYCNYFFIAPITGLTPGTTYHYLAAAANIYGGAIYPDPGWRDRSFTTLSLPDFVIINTGTGYWDAATSNLNYSSSFPSGAHSFVLLQTADATSPLSTWTRVATNNSTSGSFPIPPAGTAGARYYRIKSE